MTNNRSGRFAVFSPNLLFRQQYASCPCCRGSGEAGVLLLGLMTAAEGKLFVLNGQCPVKLIMQMLRGCGAALHASCSPRRSSLVRPQRCGELCQRPDVISR